MRLPLLAEGAARLTQIDPGHEQKRLFRIFHSAFVPAPTFAETSRRSEQPDRRLWLGMMAGKPAVLIPLLARLRIHKSLS